MNEPCLYLDYGEIKATLEGILAKRGFSHKRAGQLAGIFSDNSLDGKDSHGINRFPAFLETVKKGVVKPDAAPGKVKGFQGIEQWDGRLGPGPLNALACTDRAMVLADEYGIGCVALRNTNHWLRGGTYGLHAAKTGHPLVCWSNTKPNMPAWGSREARLGNNPLIIAVPREPDPVVLDIAMTQYSYGTLEVSSRRRERLSHNGGFDREGNLTNNPDEIMASQRPLPIGLWKGAGLALVLDLMTVLLSEGRSTREVGEHEVEYALSQVFIAFQAGYDGKQGIHLSAIDTIIDDFHQSTKGKDDPVWYPGERSLKVRKERLEHGIPVDCSFWESVKEM